MLVVAACAGPERLEAPSVTAQALYDDPLADVSGLAWVAGDTFLVAHDAKVLYEPDLPRISIFVLPDTVNSPRSWPLPLRWPSETGPGSDLESIARIPGTDSYLLVESGDDTSAYQRIYHVRYADGRLAMVEAVTWPEQVGNVEGSAVARVGERLYFLYAERAHGQGATRLRWAPLSVRPLRFGPFEQAVLRVPRPAGPDARPVSALEVAPDGRILVASAADPGVDTGPYQGRVWEVGRLDPDGAGGVRLTMRPEPEPIAVLDGLKIEALALRPAAGGVLELFIGTDDERFGGTIRPLPN